MLVDLFFLSKLFSLSFCIYFLALHCQLFSMKIIIVLANIFIIYDSCVECSWVGAGVGVRMVEERGV